MRRHSGGALHAHPESMFDAFEGAGRTIVAITRGGSLTQPEGEMVGTLLKSMLLLCTVAMCQASAAQTFGPRTLQELKEETQRRADRNLSPLTGIKPEDAREALAAIGDQFAVYGYSGQGRNQVDFVVVKGFDELVTGRAGAKLGGIVPLQQNRDGAAMRVLFDQAQDRFGG